MVIELLVGEKMKGQEKEKLQAVCTQGPVCTDVCS